jgi:hypothetical protein
LIRRYLNKISAESLKDPLKKFLPEICIENNCHEYKETTQRECRDNIAWNRYFLPDYSINTSIPPPQLPAQPTPEILAPTSAMLRQELYERMEYQPSSLETCSFSVLNQGYPAGDMIVCAGI